MKKVSVCFAMIAAAIAANAADFTLKTGVSGVFDWTDGTNYDGSQAPTVGNSDAVCVPDGVEVLITNGMHAASIALINSLSRIRPMGDDSKVKFFVEEGQTLTIDCAVNWTGEASGCRGEIVKAGGGVLHFTAPADRFKYGAHCTAFYVAITVNEGELRMNQTWAIASGDVYYGKVTVAEGATWRPFAALKAIVYGGFWGGGTITNAATGSQHFYVSGGTAAAPCVFSGKLLGHCSIGLNATSYQDLTGTNSTGTGTFDCNGNMFVDGGRAGVRKFGKKGLPSSIGTQSASGTVIASRNGAWLLSLREKDDPIDECDKPFTIFSGDGQGSLVVDGGAEGGVRFTGQWSEHSTSPGQKRIVLTGSNTEECVLSSRFTRKTNSDYPTGGYTFHIRKTGTGVWRMAYNSNSTFSGVVAVDNGTLKFDSIAEKGTLCALGSALDLYGPLDAHGVALTSSNQVDYAFLLGDGTAAAEGNFEYSGTAAAACSTRPLAVNGRGRLTNGTAHDFNFSDVYTLGTDPNVLTLDGDDTDAMNFLSGVDDGKEATGGPLSLVKEGAGTWRLSGTNHIRGSITVKEGTLILKNTYTWYRWNFKANQCVIGVDTASEALNVAADEFGLYAADGTRLNRGLTGALTYPNLAAGEIAPAFVAGTWTPKVGDGSNVSNLCDDGTAVMSQWYYPSSPWYDGDGIEHPKSDSVQHWYPSQPTTWYRILMRLPEDTPIVAGYDVAANDSKFSPSLWSVDASVNGLTWDEVSPDTSAVKPSQTNWWLIAGRLHTAGSDLVHTNTQGVADMAAFAKTTPVPAAEFFPDVSSVRVDSGATLKVNGTFTVRGLEVDCGGAGKIDGATFAANGTLDLVHYVNSLQPTVLPLVVTNSVGLANVAEWTVSVEGQGRPGMKATLKDGKITVFSSGTAILIR